MKVFWNRECEKRKFSEANARGVENERVRLREE